MHDGMPDLPMGNQIRIVPKTRLPDERSNLGLFTESGNGARDLSSELFVTAVVKDVGMLGHPVRTQALAVQRFLALPTSDDVAFVVEKRLAVGTHSAPWREIIRSRRRWSCRLRVGTLVRGNAHHTREGGLFLRVWPDRTGAINT